LLDSTQGLVREAFFLESSKGRLFCLSTAPAGELRGGIILVPPFAEEMNKSRRMTALAARAFARKGWLVLQPDLYGTGDSEGDFAEADWDVWQHDLGACWAWLGEHISDLPKVLWTLRLGSLLAANWLERSGARARLLLWQPVSSGRQHLTQFLRLKVVNEMLAEADARTAMSRFRAALEQGEVVEVAGYGLSPALASGMERADFAPSPEVVESVYALEVISGGREGVSPGLVRLVEACKARGIRCEAAAVDGSPFWSTQEIELAPALIDASCAALDEWR
jgi:exosortase A-associated hydrolase 2